VKPARVYLFVALGALVLAALLNYWIARYQRRLPADYSNSQQLSEVDKFAILPPAKWGGEHPGYSPCGPDH